MITLEIEDLKIEVGYNYNGEHKSVEINECYSEKIKEELARIIMEYESIKEKD